MILQILSWLSAILTLTSLWQAPENPKWWLGYLAASIIYTVVMFANGLPEWGAMGIFFTGVGIKNYVKK